MTNKEPTHDHFFKVALSNKKVAKNFIEQYVPKNIVQTMDLDTVEQTATNFISSELKLQVVDVLLKVNMNNRPGYVYTLLEHQSSPERLMPFRILQYMIAIMDHHVKQYKTYRLPTVYPVLVYNGQGKYPYSMELLELFECRVIMEEVLLKECSLLDLSEIPDKALRTDLWSSLTLLSLKHIRDEDLMVFLKQIQPQIQQMMVEPFGGQFLISMVKYFVNKGQVGDPTEFLNYIRGTVSPEAEDEIMNIATQLKELGKLEGRKEGKLEGKRESEHFLIKTMLSKGFAPNLIRDLVSDFSLEEIQAFASELETEAEETVQ